MSYQVTYGEKDAVTGPLPRKKSGLGLYTALFFAAFLVLTFAFWPDGRAVLEELLFPGSGAKTMEALEVMASSLREGEPVRRAVDAFCREVLGSLR